MPSIRNFSNASQFAVSLIVEGTLSAYNHKATPCCVQGRYTFLSAVVVILKEVSKERRRKAEEKSVGRWVGLGGNGIAR